MKISTFNKIEKYYWAFWRGLTIGLSIIFIIFLLIQIKGNNVTFTVKGQQVVYQKVVEPQECDLDAAIKKFKTKHNLNEIFMFGWDYSKEKWNLEYKDSYEGQKVEITKKFVTVSDMINFLNSK